MGGIVYTHNLVRALATLPQEERPRMTLFCPRSANLFKNIEPLVDHLWVYKPLLEVPPHRKLLYAARYVKTGITVSLLGEAQPELAFAAHRAHVDALFAVTNPYTRLLPNAIAWIPDLLHCALPDLFSPVERNSRHHRFTRLLHDPSRHVVFSSNHALRHAGESYGPVTARTHVMHFATVPEPSWHDDPAPTQAQYGVPPAYFMNCNLWAVHKDHATVIRAVHVLARKGIKVHVVCTGDTWDRRHPDHFAALQEEIKKLGLESQFQILGLIPRIDQVRLIRGASAVIQPSLFEGWSTVIEDARALGTPVIASDFPVHIEQNAPDCLFFRRGDAEDCARAIQERLVRPEIRFHPDGQHMRRVRDFARCFVEIVRSTVSQD
jgi:glycosyltransferase involved in cell wall biosynthesis